mgnify:CR=1 FL=1
MKQESIWHINRTFETKKLNNNIKTDILIIGGGITGISTAFYLKESNLSINLIQDGEVIKDRVGVYFNPILVIVKLTHPSKPTNFITKIWQMGYNALYLY